MSWICVDDELPNDGVQVLARGWDNGIVGENKHHVVAELCRGDWFSENGDEEYTYLTHWMHIPD